MDLNSAKQEVTNLAVFNNAMEVGVKEADIDDTRNRENSVLYFTTREPFYVYIIFCDGTKREYHAKAVEVEKHFHNVLYPLDEKIAAADMDYMSVILADYEEIAV